MDAVLLSPSGNEASPKQASTATTTSTSSASTAFAGELVGAQRALAGPSGQADGSRTLQAQIGVAPSSANGVQAGSQEVRTLDLTDLSVRLATGRTSGRTNENGTLVQVLPNAASVQTDGEGAGTTGDTSTNGDVKTVAAKKTLPLLLISPESVPSGSGRAAAATTDAQSGVSASQESVRKSISVPGLGPKGEGSIQSLLESVSSSKLQSDGENGSPSTGKPGSKADAKKTVPLLLPSAENGSKSGSLSGSAQGEGTRTNGSGSGRASAAARSSDGSAPAYRKVLRLLSSDGASAKQTAPEPEAGTKHQTSTGNPSGKGSEEAVAGRRRPGGPNAQPSSTGRPLADGGAEGTRSSSSQRVQTHAGNPASKTARVLSAQQQASQSARGEVPQPTKGASEAATEAKEKASLPNASSLEGKRGGSKLVSSDGRSSRPTKYVGQSTQHGTGGTGQQQSGQGAGQNSAGQNPQGRQGAPEQNVPSRNKATPSFSATLSGTDAGSSQTSSTSELFSNGGVTLDADGKGWTASLSDSGKAASSSKGRAGSGPPRTLPSAWLNAAKQAPLRTAELSGGWNAMKLGLGADKGTVTVKARQGQESMSVSVGFSESRVQAQVTANARQLQEAMQNQYGTDVDLSFSDGDPRDSGEHGADGSAPDRTTPSTSNAEPAADDESPGDASIRSRGRREWVG